MLGSNGDGFGWLPPDRFGTWWGPFARESWLAALVFLMIADVVLGVMLAIDTRTFRWLALFRGIRKKLVILLAVLVAFTVESMHPVAGTVAFGHLVTGWFALRELISFIDGLTQFGISADPLDWVVQRWLDWFRQHSRTTKEELRHNDMQRSARLDQKAADVKEVWESGDLKADTGVYDRIDERKPPRPRKVGSSVIRAPDKPDPK